MEWYNRSMAPVPRCEQFTEHGVRHGTDTEPVRRRRHHERGEQNSLKARLARQLGDRGQDGADAEEGGGHDGGEGETRARGRGRRRSRGLGFPFHRRLGKR